MYQFLYKRKMRTLPRSRPVHAAIDWQLTPEPIKDERHEHT